MTKHLSFWLLLTLLWPVCAAQPLPHAALVIDTSGSMADNDPRRHAVHFAKVLGRTLAGAADVDAFHAKRTDCRTESVARHGLDGADPPSWERSLEQQVRYAGFNTFGPTTAAARNALDTGAPSVLLLLADQGGRAATEIRAKTDAEIARRVDEAGGRHGNVDVRVSLLWNTTDDLDLYVTTPSGKVIYFGDRNQDRGVLDVDRNVGGGTRKPVENVRWARGKAPEGEYRVVVRNHSFNESRHRPIAFSIEIVSGGWVERHQGTISPNGETGSGSVLEVARFRYPPPSTAVDRDAVAAEISRLDQALNPDQRGCSDPVKAIKAAKRAGAGLVSIQFGAGASPFHGLRSMDAKLKIGSSAELTAAVAKVTKRWFARPRLQQGAGNSRVELRIPEHTGELWLLISGDGDLSRLRASGSNPAAAAIDLDVAAGRTASADGRGHIHYRVIRVREPAAGTWRFEADGVALGWLYETKRAYDLRLVSGEQPFVERDNPILIEVLDPATGEALTDPDLIASVHLSARFANRDLALRDDGREPDQTAADGRFSGTLHPLREGPQDLTASLTIDGFERERRFPLHVVGSSWGLQHDLPATHRRDTPLLMSVSLVQIGRYAPPVPESVLARFDGGEVGLRDDGSNGDETAGDHIYSGLWTPRQIGPVSFDFIGRGEALLEAPIAEIEVVGWVELQGPERIDFGALASREHSDAVLDLSASELHGSAELELTAVLEAGGLELALESDGELRSLSPDHPLRVVLNEDRQHWSLRLRAPRCPPESSDRRIGELHIQGGGKTITVALEAATKPLPWYICLWPFLLAAALALLLAFVIWGFISPARFPRTLGIMLSPEEDLDEGFFLLVRSGKGTGSGFYRNARAYISTDFRISGKRGKGNQGEGTYSQ